MDSITQNIYKTFDKEGIKLKPISKIRMFFDRDERENSIKSTFDYLPFKLQKDEFNLNNDEFIEKIIEYIYDTTSIRIKTLKELENFPSINNLPFILKLNEHNNDCITFALASGKLPGSVIIREENEILSLGNITEIEGDLGLQRTSVSSFGQLKKISGSLWISYHNPVSNLKDLNNIEEIGENLLLRGFPIKNLLNLKKVGGTLNLRGTNIEDLGNLEFVGEHLYLPKEKRNHFNLNKIYIGGNVKYFSS